MKNKIKIAFGLLLAMVIASCACACGTKDAVVADEVLYGFESYNEIASLTPRNYMGSAELCEDQKYVTQGEKSLKWYIEAPFHGLNTTVSQGTYATPHFKIFAGNFFKDISEFSDVNHYSLDVVNANDFPVYALLWCESGNSPIASAHLELAAGESGTIVMPINRLSTASLNSLSAINFGVYTEHFDKPVTIYADNLRVIKGQADPVDIVVPKSGKLIGFDDVAYMDYVYPINTYPMPMVSLGYNVNPIFCGEMKGSLKADVLPCTNGSHMLVPEYLNENQRNGFGITGELVKKIDFEVAKFLPGAKLKLDIYSASNAPMNAYIEIKDASGNTSLTRAKLEPEAWNTVIANDFDGVDFKNVTEINVLFDMYSVYKPMSFYCNNLRMEG